MKLIAIVGTNSKRSTNRRLLQFIQAHFKEQAEIDICEIADLPAFNEPDDKTAPAEVQALSDIIVAADGASLGALGSSRAQAHLRQILDAPEVKARIMPSAEFLLGHSMQAFDDQGQLIDQDKVAELDDCFNEFLLFVKITNQLVDAYSTAKERATTFSWEQA